MQLKQYIGQLSVQCLGFTHGLCGSSDRLATVYTACLIDSGPFLSTAPAVLGGHPMTLVPPCFGLLLQVGCTFTNNVNSWNLLGSLYGSKPQLCMAPSVLGFALLQSSYLHRYFSWPLTVQTLAALRDSFMPSKPVPSG